LRTRLNVITIKCSHRTSPPVIPGRYVWDL
jgi:hypothetical protein